jgi:translocator protein
MFMKKVSIKIVMAVVLCLAVGGLSGALTASAIQDYYLTLNKPSWNPPNWIFGPVWTTLYVCMGVAFGLVWHKGAHNSVKLVFGLQLAANFMWSIIFFKWQSIGGALAEIVLLWGLILACIISFRPYSKWAVGLMIPYLLWVSFAAFLNYAIFTIN